MKPGTFDDFTRALARPTTRRSALGRIAGMLGLGTVGGAALAGLSPGIALAGGGNSDCAHFCNAVFDPGPDRGQCKSDGAHGTGLCQACGNGMQSVCCPQNPDGTCTSYSSATCCSSGQVCMSGTCVAACPSGHVLLSNGTCVTACGVGCATPCPSACFCYCSRGLCFSGGPTTGCTTDNNCPTGLFCVGGRCVSAC
jgi:hypothetical protein